MKAFDTSCSSGQRPSSTPTLFCFPSQTLRHK